MQPQCVQTIEDALALLNMSERAGAVHGPTMRTTRTAPVNSSMKRITARVTLNRPVQRKMMMNWPTASKMNCRSQAST